MAKDTPFKAYDLRRRRPHAIDTPPAKITTHRFRREEWAVLKSGVSAASTKKGKRRGAMTKKRPAKKAPKRASDILRCDSGEIACLYCGRLGDDPDCGTKCYRRFRKENCVANLIEIKGPGPLGYGAFTKPNARISKGQWLDEYIGELLPCGANEKSLYRFEVGGVCSIDSESAGNWTRFINSHCRPNVKPWADFVGKRHVVWFQALRDIGPEEEIVFNYGTNYFERAGFGCACNAYNRPHMPGGGVLKPKR